eukprot:g5451.t1
MQVTKRRSEISETIPSEEVLTANALLRRQGSKPSEPKRTRVEMNEDTELHKFIHGITNLAKKEGIAPTLLLACIVSESHFTDPQFTTHLVEDTEFKEGKERLTRLLFQLTWRQEFDAFFSESNTNEEDLRSTELMQSNTTTLEDADRLRRVAERQLEEKTQADKKAARIAKVERWRSKKKVFHEQFLSVVIELILLIEAEVYLNDQVSSSAAIGENSETKKRTIRQ